MSTYSWRYDPSGPSLRTTSRRTLVTNMGNPGSHPTRTLLLSHNHPDILVVSRDSGENEDDDALDRSTGISQIRAFNISALSNDDDPYDYTDGDLLGWSLRNSVGVSEHPETGGIWSVENSVDDLSRRGGDIHADNPAEELNFHGYLNDSDASLGGNYGYPLCYTILSTENFPSLGDLAIGEQSPADWEGDHDVTLPGDDECSTEYVPPVLPFQAHTAPLDIKFDENGTRAYVSFHGSWNREVPVGYDVSYVSFNNGRPSAPQDSTNTTISIIYNIDRPTVRATASALSASHGTRQGVCGSALTAPARSSS
ncbi:hypothetical protein NW754_010252 [Fusarium falciforme]|uniref:Pyrroloquinoline quinone-dependent pyranose dehydrogenase beta-propeller domain-containing protein n=1 Tax=Fusarium falciforme TaxID=195108 RepID=A0A9W8RBP0_9HYPO|nr:hypothetical protein NW754_010252 [Fusarium falciforme]KAJ4191009.1 hypothetical protein NW755_005220 [Fusarium falciforme]KAJ4256952.1 hypothetical protein NW757_003580 [Fusarium falciforme]